MDYVKPTNFDLIVVGTGLTESIIAAAAAGARKTVLQICPEDYFDYNPFASLPPDHLTSFLHSHSQSHHPPIIQPITTTANDNKNDGEEEPFKVLPLNTRPLYSSVDVNIYSSEEDVFKCPREFRLDLAGPRVLFCADAMTDLVEDANFGIAMDFENVDACFICGGGGGGSSWNNVPDSRRAIFKDRSLSLKEKNQLMRFFKIVQNHCDYINRNNDNNNRNYDGRENENEEIRQEDLESPFVEFLSRKMELSPKLISILLYAIAMVDYEQENLEVCKEVLKTKDGIDRLILYHSSFGRFPHITGAMMYPVYGQGELLFRFSRCAGVNGCLCAQIPVVGLLVDKDVGNYRGVKLSTGQELFSHQLILAPSFIIPSGLTPPTSLCLQDNYYDSGLRNAKEKVVRGICITKSSLKPDVGNFLLFYPPRSLCPEQLASVRVFQLSSNVSACPSGMFVVYLSTVCEDVVRGKKSLIAAIDALFSIPFTGNSDETSKDPLSENAVVRVKPTLLWNTLYIQELTMDCGGSDCVISTPMPDGNLQYNNHVDAAIKLFRKMYPDEKFFPKMIWWQNVVTYNCASSLEH